MADKIYSIRIDGVDNSIKNLNQLRAAITATDRELKKAEFGTAKFNELAQRSAQLKAAQADLNKQLAGTQATADKMSNAFGGVFAQLGKMDGQIGQTTSLLGGMAESAGGAGSALKGIVSAGPVAAVLGVIMLALTPLLAAFGRMPGIMDKINAAWDATMAVARQLASTIADLGDAAIAFVSGDFELAGKKVDEFTNKVSTLGDTVVETFNKAFDLSLQRKELERTGAEVQRVTKILEQQKAVIDAQIANEAQSYSERIELVKKRGQIEEQIAAQLQSQAQKELEMFKKVIAQDQYRTGVIVNGQLDRQKATEEEAKAWDDLTTRVAEANTRVQTSTINTTNQIVAFKKAQGEKLLELARIQNDKEKVMMEQQLAFIKRNNDTNYQDQVKLIDSLLAKRVEILDKEMQHIADYNSQNGKLNEEWTAKIADLEKIKLEAVLQSENAKQEAIKQSQAISIQRAQAQTDMDIKVAQQSAEFAKNDIEYQSQILELTQNEASVKQQLAQQSGSLAQLEQARQAAQQVITEQQKLQTMQIQQQYNAQSEQLNLEQQKLQIELQSLQASQNQTEADKARVAIIQQELALLQQKQAGLKVKLDIDTQGIAQQTKAAIDNTAMQFQQMQNQMLQQQVQMVTSSITQVMGAVNMLFDALDAAQKERIDRQMAILDEEATAINEQISATESALAETFTNIQTLQAKADEARGSRQQGALALLDQEKKKRNDLEKQRQQELQQQKQIAAQQKTLDAEKAQMEKEAAKRTAAMSLIQQAANIAVAITQAATVPFPANIAAIASTIAAVVASLATVTSMVQSYEKGGQLPKRATGGLLSGPSHARGGIMAMADGVPVANVQGGEYVINKEATQQFLPLLDSINKFENGGIIPPNLQNLGSMASATQENGTNQKILENLVALVQINTQIAQNTPVIGIVEIAKGLKNVASLTESTKI